MSQPPQPSTSELKVEIERLRADLRQFEGAKERWETEARSVADEKAQLELEKLRKDLGKADAELRKLNADASKIEHETEKLQLDLSPDPARFPRGDKELKKLDKEIDKLEFDRRNARWTVWLELGKSIGTLVGFLAALGTFMVGFCTLQTNIEAGVQKELGELLQNLGQPEPSKQVAAAIGLRSYLKDEPRRSVVIDGLAYGLGLASVPEVQQAITESLIQGGTASIGPIQLMLTRSEGEVREGFTRMAHAATPEMNRAERERVNARQSAMIAGIVALARIRRGGSGAPYVFDGHNFKTYPFYKLGLNFRGASFKDAVVENADFFKTDLANANFAGADATDASFIQALMQGTVFTDADLERADFTNATSLGPSQLQAAKELACARVDASLAAALKQRLNPPGRNCP